MVKRGVKRLSFSSFAIYNNQNDDIVKYIIKHNGHIRAGMEDSIYCGNRKAADNKHFIIPLITNISRNK